MESGSSQSVTQWLGDLKRGDAEAAQKLWHRYVQRLTRLADKKLRNLPRRAADEEDVVVAVFASFCRGVEEGRFCRLDDRDDLWQVLVMLTDRKATDQMRRELAAKRGGGHVRGESILAGVDTDGSGPLGMQQIADGEPTPGFAAQVADELRCLLGKLGNAKLCEIAQNKLAGYSNPEIAGRMDTSLRSVERGVHLIRRLWLEGAQE